MRGQAEFLRVIRLEDGVEMVVVDHVARKYPDRFQIIGPLNEERPKKVVKKKAPAKKIGNKGVARAEEKKEE